MLIPGKTLCYYDYILLGKHFLVLVQGGLRVFLVPEFSFLCLLVVMPLFLGRHEFLKLNRMRPKMSPHRRGVPITAGEGFSAEEAFSRFRTINFLKKFPDEGSFYHVDG